ncbi:MAG: hypothetical protein WC471_06075 [Candidatus Woesearchaeota archaeon]|jgi:hypothetical protein
MANPTKENSQLADKNGKPLIGSQQANIPVVTDALDGATLTGTALTTSATPTVDELETAVGVLGGKVNAIIAVLEAHGLTAA